MKLVIWTKTDGKGFNITSAFNRNKLVDFLAKHIGEWIKLTIELKTKPKSEKILGYWWGAILVTYVAHNKGLKFKTELCNELVKEKLVTSNEIDDAHNTLMTEFRPIWVDTLNGEPTKQRGEMKKMNNPDVMKLISEVLDYFADNGYPIPNPEEYKGVLDSVKLVKQETEDIAMGNMPEVEYPEIESGIEPTI